MFPHLEARVLRAGVVHGSLDLMLLLPFGASTAGSCLDFQKSWKPPEFTAVLATCDSASSLKRAHHVRNSI